MLEATCSFSAKSIDKYACMHRMLAWRPPTGTAIVELGDRMSMVATGGGKFSIQLRGESKFWAIFVDKMNKFLIDKNNVISQTKVGLGR